MRSKGGGSSGNGGGGNGGSRARGNNGSGGGNSSNGSGGGGDGKGDGGKANGRQPNHMWRERKAWQCVSHGNVLTMATLVIWVLDSPSSSIARARGLLRDWRSSSHRKTITRRDSDREIWLWLPVALYAPFKSGPWRRSGRLPERGEGCEAMQSRLPGFAQQKASIIAGAS
ncbi:H/ACA ribonucleoprotein complex subunit 1-like [Selaginella moellendorffii]|uniref:H/ACA ribonucleoprotein complex subunit 1-like n=1 Tax=Selaginella moellendorffii TaxID=88036 RepID=UPI000D1C67E3|nr:H/ACA ribonucleoprotein complex subunit 1-like [Selaginella moellendorffii]|eukprot:XP_024541269.1 H/ACA ribonucleoprotein complex subunit 1-like [Selaginella moellendorffii]